MLQLYPTAEVPTITTQVQAQTREVIDRRINGLGVAEPSISNVGSNRILVELPAVKDPDQAEKVLKQVAVLEYKIVPFDVMQKADAAVQALLQPNINAKDKAAAQLYVNQTAYQKSGPVVYSGKDLKGAQASYDQAGRPDITFQTKDPARFGKLTSSNSAEAARHLSSITTISRRRSFRAPFTTAVRSPAASAKRTPLRLANELNAGALPVTREDHRERDDRPDAR